MVAENDHGAQPLIQLHVAKLRITGKSMCLGIDIRQSEQEVFNI